MEYAQTHFGKLLGQLTYEDVKNFFSEAREETDQLEFKSCHAQGNLDSNLMALSEGISAFLNSSGGLLVWGAPSGRKVEGKKEKVFTGDLTHVPSSIEKDWLISKVSDKIVPLPSGVRVQIIEGQGEEKVCVFEVDKSPTSPHQVDGVYPMRLDGQNRPAPHHYVEALMKKISFPILEAYIKVTSWSEIEGVYYIGITMFFINVSPFDNEEEFTFKAEVAGGKFMDSMDKNYSHTFKIGFDKDGSRYNSEANKCILSFGEDKMVIQTLEFQPDVLAENNHTASLSLSFGGKKSPIIYCRYIFDFNDLSSSDVKYGSTPILNRRIKIEFENKLLSDLHNEYGLTKTKLLENMEVIR